MIKGKTPDEIRKIFNIKNDFTPEEEEEVRRENQWAFEWRFKLSSQCGSYYDRKCYINCYAALLFSLASSKLMSSFKVEVFSQTGGVLLQTSSLWSLIEVCQRTSFLSQHDQILCMQFILNLSLLNWCLWIVVHFINQLCRMPSYDLSKQLFVLYYLFPCPWGWLFVIAMI